jgi:hypothetical protein
MTAGKSTVTTIEGTMHAQQIRDELLLLSLNAKTGAIIAKSNSFRLLLLIDNYGR